MARVPYPDVDQLEPATVELLGKLPPLNIFRMLAASEGALGAFVRLGNHLLFKSSLEPLLREIAIVRVGVLSAAGYEVYQHERIARSVGATDELVDAIREGPDAASFDDDQRIVMRFTDDVVANVRACDDTFDRVVDRFGVRAAQELTLTIGFYMMASRFLETFGVDIEPDLTDDR